MRTYVSYRRDDPVFFFIYLITSNYFIINFPFGAENCPTSTVSSTCKYGHIREIYKSILNNFSSIHSVHEPSLIQCFNICNNKRVEVHSDTTWFSEEEEDVYVMNKQFWFWWLFCFPRLIRRMHLSLWDWFTHKLFFYRGDITSFCKNQRLGETSILLCTKIISLCYFYPFRCINYLNKDLQFQCLCDLFCGAKREALVQGICTNL